jgi:hypothetical protein
MTLKERILPLVADGSYVEITARTIEDIADEFAIGFAEWCVKKRIDFFDSTEIGETYTIDGNVSKYKMNELLEIYKQGL